MGWSYQAAQFYTKSGAIDRKKECDKMSSWEYKEHKAELLKSAMKGSVYYAAIKHTDLATGESEVIAHIILTHTDMKSYCNFGYKDMTESAGPFCYDCPKSILDLLSETDNKYAKEWREECRRNLQSKKALSALKIGQVIEMKWGNEVIRLKKMAPAYQFKKPWFYRAENDSYMKKSNIVDWKLVEE